MNPYAEDFGLKFDEINKLASTSYQTARDEYGDDDEAVSQKVSDDILSMMINGYRLGVDHVHGMLNIDSVDEDPVGGGDPKKKTEQDLEEVEDLILWYGMPMEFTSVTPSESKTVKERIVTPSESKRVMTEQDLEDMEEALFVLCDGKTFADRVSEHVQNDDKNAIKRLAETEYHRCYNTGGLNTAKQVGGGVMKTWYTKLDERVRATHDLLESVSVPLDEDFYTFDGDYAPAPGLFNNASNNVNCRCIVIYNRQGRR